MKTFKLSAVIILMCSLAIFSCKSKSNDGDIQSKISEKYASTPELNGASAMVTDGVVTLSGTLKDDAAKTEAETIAKEVKGVKSVTNHIMVAPAEIATPAMGSDSSLHAGVIDATKDFPGVTATVTDGEITLTGNIKRTQLPTLMQSLNSLNPKKINNNLTIK
jgi:hyperosmotically inducible periplasmic protein